MTTLGHRYADRPHVSVHQADLAAEEWPNLEGEAIDTVVCLNVLEHLPDDAYVLTRFWDALVPGGRLVLLVPAHRWLHGTIDRAIGHYRRYERRSLCALIAQCGFVVESAEYLNPVGVAGWFLNSRVLNRAAVPLQQARLFDALFPLFERTQALGLPIGISVLAVGRKPPS